VTAHRADDPEA